MQGRRESVELEVRAWAKATEVQTTLYWLSVDSGSSSCDREHFTIRGDRRDKCRRTSTRLFCSA